MSSNYDLDFKYNKELKCFDIHFDDTGGDLVYTEGLNTAFGISLLECRRADESVIPKAGDRGGWLGNEILGFTDYEIGSLMYLVYQGRINIDSLNKGITYLYECLSWMIEDDIFYKILVSHNNDTIEPIYTIKMYVSKNILLTYNINLLTYTYEEVITG